MTTTRGIGAGVLLGAVLLGAAWTPAGAEPKKAASRAKYGTEVWFSPNGGAADSTASAIAGAKTSVDVAMYSIYTAGPIFEALQGATARGVKVRMVLNHAGGEAKAKALKLESIGVDVRFVGKTMHEKFAVVDGKAVLNGSGNWSANADLKYNENMVSFAGHAGLVDQFQSEFDYLWASSKDIRPDGSTVNPGGSGAATPPVGGGGEGTAAYFTSANDDGGESVIASRIIDAIRAARSTVEIAVAHFDHPAIADAILALQHERNENADPNDDVDIRVLVDQGEYAAGISQVKRLEAKKVAVRYKTYSMGYSYPRAQLMHHKYVLIDGATLLSGSYNWSQTAEHENYENLVVTEKNPYLARKFGAEFEKLWGLNRDAYAGFRDAILSKPGAPGYRRVIPLHFDVPYFNTPMTLSRSELQPIRSKMYAIGFFKDRKFKDASFFDKETGKPVFAPPAGTLTGPPAKGPGIVDLLPR